MNQATLGLHMIVRNEESVLDRCLESVEGQWDQLVIVDTGSTDSTRDIAKRRGALVVDFLWCDDFSKARNLALSILDTDFAYWLDADDIVLGQPRSHLSPSRWRYQTASASLSWWRERLVPRGWEWVGRCHEVLIGPDLLVDDDSVVVIHSPSIHPPDSRNLRILLRQQAEGESMNARTLFYLGRELSDHGRFAEAAIVFGEAADKDSWNDQRYYALYYAGRCSIHLDRARSRKDFLQALPIKPSWPLAYLGLAELSYFEQAWEECIAWCDVARRLPPPETTLFVSERFLRVEWIIWYVCALWHTGRRDEARRWTTIGLELDPTNVWHLENAKKLGEDKQ